MKTYSVLNWSRRHEDWCDSGGIAARRLILGSRWRWVVRFTPRPLYHRYPFNKMLGRSQSQYGHGEEKKFSAPAESRTVCFRSLCPACHRLLEFTVLTVLDDVCMLWSSLLCVILCCIHMSKFITVLCFSITCKCWTSFMVRDSPGK